MLRTLRPFLITLVCTWLALIVAAIVYSKRLTHSSWIFTAALPAFLFESALYLGSIFTETRACFASLRPVRLQGMLLWASALIPYTILSFAAGTFHGNAFYLLAVLTGAFAMWHAILPRRLAYDVGFLVIAAAPFITRVFTRLYISPDPHAQMDILGHLMWIRTGVIAMLVLRAWNPGPFSFWPTAREWRMGGFAFLCAIIPLLGLALALHDVRYAPSTGPWWRVGGLTLGYFFSALWVIAIGEELFFRGVIERALLDHWKIPPVAVAVSAVLYGCAHLWYRAFPNWQHTVVTTLLGVALGIVYFRAGSVRACMVTHALVVTTWRLFFK
jgi:membrane protease YdiL (CAAX protease family)